MSDTAGVRESFILEYYYDAVSAAGGTPVLLPPVLGKEAVRAALGLVDGLALIGGDDLDPARYGEAKHEKTRLLVPRRDEFDMQLAREALGGGLPIFAICGGCQLVNVAMGGTLHQHLPDVYGNTIEHARSDEIRRQGREVMHEAAILKGSLLHEILGVETLRVNSSHHQSVNRVAAGLRVTARAEDGVVEALERGGLAEKVESRKEKGEQKWLLAVQWHPERMKGVREHERLFEAFVETLRGGKAE